MLHYPWGMLGGGGPLPVADLVAGEREPLRRRPIPRISGIMNGRLRSSQGLHRCIYKWQRRDECGGLDCPKPEMTDAQMIIVSLVIGALLTLWIYRRENRR